MVFQSETGENIEERNKAYHTDTGNGSVYPVCSGTDLFPFLFRRIWKSSNGRTGIQVYLIPFVEIRRFWVYRKQLGFLAVFTNLFGNVIGFLPFGFILPVILERMRSGWLIILAGFGLSVTVEVIQLITKVGCFDVDDMILNTAGAALGYLLFFICDHLRRKIYGKKI